MKGSNQFNIMAEFAITGVLRETLSRTRLRIPTVTTMVQETLFLFQNDKKAISEVPL